MSFETQDSRPNRAHNEEELTAEAGFSVPETLPPALGVPYNKLSPFQRYKRDGKMLIEMVRKTDPADIIRGMTSGF